MGWWVGGLVFGNCVAIATQRRAHVVHTFVFIVLLVPVN